MCNKVRYLRSQNPTYVSLRFGILKLLNVNSERNLNLYYDLSSPVGKKYCFMLMDKEVRNFQLAVEDTFSSLHPWECTYSPVPQ